MDIEIEQALRRHLAQHARRLAAGEERLGWKIAFNAPPMQQRLGLSHSLVAGLTRSSLCSAGTSLSLHGGTRIALEAEVGVLLGSDIAAADDDDAIAAAIESVSPAIEIIDIDRSFDDLGEIIAEGVFHRGVVFGEMRTPPAAASLAGVRARIAFDGECLADLDAGAATGWPVEVLRLAAGLLAPFDEGLRAGDRVILGSMNVPPAATPGCRFELALAGWAPLSVEFDPQPR